MFPAPSVPRGGTAIVGGLLPIKLKYITAPVILTSADVGFCVLIVSNVGYSLTLPLVNTVQPGAVIQIINASVASTLINRAGSDTISGGSSGTSFTLKESGPSATFVAWSGQWYAIAQGSVGTGLGAVAVGPAAYGLGTGSIAIGANSTANSTSAINIGSGIATGNNSIVIGNGTTDSNYQTSIGVSSSGSTSVATTGAGAMALGGSYASGTDSFAAAIATNSSSYGAQGANSIAIGKQATAGGSGGVAISLFGQAAWGAQANSNSACAIGDGAIAGSVGAFAFGLWPIATPQGKYAFASGRFAVVGDAQLGAIVLRNQTTNATATVLTSTQAAANTLDQLILPNDSSYTFTGSMIARNTGSDTDSKAWTFFGAIRRGTSAATTALIGTPGINVVGSDGSAWTFTLTADTTNGGLAVTVTGEAAKTINWVCRIDTVEVTG